MTWLIIGSTAAYHWFPDWRKPKDLDLLTTERIASNRVLDVQDHGLASDLIATSTDPVFADPSLLYTLKVSHAYWDIHWSKTMFDIWQFQKRGVSLNQPLHDRLVRLWTTIHGPKKVNLAQSKDTFWQDAVKRRYDHEWLHERVKFFDRPLHESLHPDHSQVLIDRQRFEALPLAIQRLVALEEILTIAIERADLSVQSTKSARLIAVSMAHKKLCTSAAKGWFAQFCVEQAAYLVGDRSYWFDHFNTVINSLPGDTP
jgi:hypothetical protein